MLANSISWIGPNESHINRMKKVQDGNFIKVFQESNIGTPKCMIQLDIQTLKIKCQMVQRKLRHVRKIMDKKSTIEYI